jgi:2-keto-4-pentenoate hydratase/2-oxohepta-3-ene-1,7-dioic acid hydratase in catechol pathway
VEEEQLTNYTNQLKENIMKLLRVGIKGKEKPAALDKNGKIRDLSSYITDLNSDTVNFETIKKLESVDLENLPEISNPERIGACIHKPGKFVAIGLNYSDHAAESDMESPSEPIVFMKATSSINGPNDDIEISNNSKELDWEVELGIIIGNDAKNIDEKEAESHILGYCLVNDVSEREWQLKKMGQWVKGKSHDTYGPIGPYLVTKNEIANINSLNLSLDVNGQRMQTGNTDKMIFNVFFIVSYLSKFMTLQAGDIITTGTPPGVGMGKKPQVFLKAGDTIRLSIDNLGEQNSKVIAE